MNDFHLQEILELAEEWSVEQLDSYILQLEKRVENTRNLMRELTNLRKRKTKYRNVKDTGPRG
jgi:hypothetical protein